MIIKNIRIAIIAFSVAASFFFTSHSALAGQPSQKSVQAFLDHINQMQFPITNSVQHAEIVKNAGTYLDLQSLAQKALQQHWSEMNPNQQKTFMDLFWKLIENIAYPRTKKFLDGQKIIYQEPKPIERGVEITTLAKDKEAALDVPVVYHVYQENKQWKIYDVFLDGVSIAEDLQYQFDKVIQQSQFNGLIETMQNRLADAEKKINQ